MSRALAKIAPQPVQAADEDAVMGRQLFEQYTKAIGGIQEQLIFGAMMLRVRERIANNSARGTVRTGGAKSKGEGIKGWLATYAPEVKMTTAHRMMETAEVVSKACKLGAKVNLEFLLTQPEHVIAQYGWDGKLKSVLELIDGKSQRQLLLTFEQGQHGAGGGKHRPRKHQPTPEEEQAAFEQACLEDFGAVVTGMEQLGAKYQLRTEAELEHYRDVLQARLDEVTAWLALKPSKRVKPAAASFFEEA